MPWTWNWWRHDPNVQQQTDEQGQFRQSGPIDAPTFRHAEPVLRQPGQSRVIQGVIGHTSNTLYQSGSSKPKKRNLEDIHTKPQRSKRAKLSADIAPKQARSGSVDEKHLVARKRRRSATLEEEEAIVTKRARADSVGGNISSPNCAENDACNVLQNEMPSSKPISQLHLTMEELESTPIAGDYDSFQASSEFDKISLGKQSSTLAATEVPLQHDVPETTDPGTVDSGEHIDATGRQGSVDALQRRLAGIKHSIERTAYVSQNLQSNFIKLHCPSGRLIGIGLWPGSNHVPGQAKLRNEADAIEIPTSRPRSLSKNSAVIIPALKPKHYLARKASSTLQLSSLYEAKESKSRREKTASSHVRLVGIWNQSVGSPMGPQTWTE